MNARNKNILAVIELIIFGILIWAAHRAGLISNEEQRNLFTGGALGAIIGFAFLVAQKRGMQLKRPDNLRLKVSLISQYFAIFLLAAYILGASIALATGDFPISASVVLAPLAFLVFALAAARAHVVLYRERIAFQKLQAPSELGTLRFQLRERKLTRIAKSLAIVQFLFLIEAGVICHFQQKAEDAQKAGKIVAVQTELSSLQHDLNAKSQPLDALQHRLDLVKRELKSL